MFDFIRAVARIEDKLDYIIARITIVSTQISANLIALQAQVAQTVTVEQSAETLLQGLATQLATAIAASNNGDTAALPALQQQLSDSATALAAAITANTPAAP